MSPEKQVGKPGLLVRCRRRFFEPKISVKEAGRLVTSVQVMATDILESTRELAQSEIDMLRAELDTARRERNDAIERFNALDVAVNESARKARELLAATAKGGTAIVAQAKGLSNEDRKSLLRIFSALLT